MTRTASALGLALLLTLSSLSLNARSANALTPVGSDVAQSAVQADMLQTLNDHRSSVGAPTIGADARVNAAAQNHANYSSANGYMGHFETAGLPYYTGYSARDRLSAAGWTTAFVSEVATGGSSGIDGVNQLWDAPYHRLGMLHPNSVATGWGYSTVGGRGSTVGDFVYDFSTRPVNYVRSPAAGQTGIPTSWSGRESPNPLPAGVSGPVGYPIMLVYSAGRNVTMRAAEVVAPDGSRVAIYYAPQQFEYDYQVIIPQRPLASGTTYHVRFDINVNGVMATNEWDFTTAGAGGASVPPPAGTFHSAFVSESAWPTLAPGASATLTVTFQNTGTATWQRGVAGKQANLGLNGDTVAFASLGMNDGWLSANRLATTVESSVAPGQTGTFTFNVRAPAMPGAYRLPLRPVIDGVTWMDDAGVFMVIVSASSYHSKWVSQSAYPTLRVGQVSAPLTIAFANTGTSAWLRGAAGQEARLGINLDDVTWSSLGVNWPLRNRVATQTEATVASGQTATFTFQVKAPATPGVYSIHLRPVIDGTTWMEDEGVYLIITVTP
ncbi:MAG TPA: CAP domain-containing protein [Candidatus Limnocylindria bacterium]|nr:CAP domain-containing protein [Candidatus Limnocylindria bacterium]